MSNNYQALWVTKSDDGEFQTQITERNTGDLPGGDVLVRVAYSSLNFKDMLSTQGHPGVTRNFPHQPGIDAAGVVEECGHANRPPGRNWVLNGNWKILTIWWKKFLWSRCRKVWKN
jgi:NADPH:quinone reductase-like Zn-dependent oxidoreductase